MKPEIRKYILDNKEDIISLIGKTVVRDSNFETRVYWDGSEVRADHRTGSSFGLPERGDENFIGLITFDTPEWEACDYADWLAHEADDWGINDEPYPIARKVFHLGVDALATKLADPSYDDPENIREAMANNHDECNRSGHIDSWLDEVLAEVEPDLERRTGFLKDDFKELLEKLQVKETFYDLPPEIRELVEKRYSYWSQHGPSVGMALNDPDDGDPGEDQYHGEEAIYPR